MVAHTSELFARATATGKASALKHPTAKEFDPHKWLEAASLLEQPSERDLSLLRSAVWFGEQMRNLRLQFGNILEGLDRRTAYLLALAQINREHFVIRRAGDRQGLEASRAEAFELDALSHSQVQVGMPGNKLSCDDATDATVDTLPVWIYHAKFLQSGKAKVDLNIKDLGIRAMQAYSIENGIVHLWQQALWEDWRLVKDDIGIRFRPTDQESEELRSAWLWRHQAVTHQGAGHVLASLKQAQRECAAYPITFPITVVGFSEGKGQKSRFILGRPGPRSRQRANHLMQTSVLKSSYLEQFLDTPLPANGLSCWQLHQVWCVLQDALFALTPRLPKRTVLHKETLDKWAFKCRKDNLLHCIMEACTLTQEQARAALEFLTYNPEDPKHFRKGFWSMPLIDLPGGGSLAICAPALEVGALIRRVEQWLERGGLSDQLAGSGRGRKYEGFVRDQIREALEENAVLTDVGCIHSPAKPEDKSIGDIDVMFRIGTLIIVGEIKCLLTPAESIEQHRYNERLKSAALQANRKADWCRKNISRFAYQLAINKHQEDLRVIPMIIVNQGYGFSLQIDGVRVVEFSFLKCVLEDGHMVVSTAMGSSGASAFRTLVNYNSQQEAEKNLEEIFAEPPTLRRYRKRVSWGSFMFPTADGTPMTIDTTTYAPPDAEREEELLKFANMVSRTPT